MEEANLECYKHLDLNKTAFQSEGEEGWIHSLELFPVS